MRVSFKNAFGLWPRNYFAIYEFSIFRSKFASPPVVSGLNIPEWQMVKPEPIEEKLVMPNFDGIKGGPDLVMNNSAIEPETETPPSSEID